MSGGRALFEYHISLHHSQTIAISKFMPLAFEYHISLHHSQTHDLNRNACVMFEYHISLHHSQTVPIVPKKSQRLNTIYLYIILKHLHFRLML